MKRPPKPFIAVCIASRGVGHYRTIAGVMREVAPYPHIWCWAIGEPIPQAQNTVAHEALSDERVSHLWYVEDDHLLPVGVLDAMLAADAPIVAADYLLRSGRLCAIRHPLTDEVEVVGLGCTLIRREVFQAVRDPPFQVGSKLLYSRGRWEDTGHPEVAGGQDIYFSRAAKAAGYSLTVLGREWDVGHLETIRAGDRANHGQDTVRCWGGDPAMPWYPHKNRGGMTVAEHVYISNGSATITMDPDSSEYQKYIDRGWKRVNANEGKKAVAAQQERGEQIVAETTAAMEKEHS